MFHTSIIATQRKYHQHFNTATAFNANMMNNLITRFEEWGAVFDLPRPNVHRAVLNEEAVKAE